jgi:hypothetical protein
MNLKLYCKRAFFHDNRNRGRVTTWDFTGINYSYKYFDVYNFTHSSETFVKEALELRNAEISLNHAESNTIQVSTS